MTVTMYTRCDWCGEKIVDGDATMELEWHGRDPERLSGRVIVVGEDVAHYHSSEGRDCYARVRGTLSLLLESAPSLAQMPTTSDEGSAS